MMLKKVRKLISAALPVTVVALIAGCGQSSGVAVSRTANHPVPSLAACVQQWNNVPLGNGRLSAAGEAMKGKAALMFAFGNGACGLAFSTTNPDNAAEKPRETYVSIGEGNYRLYWSPLGLVRGSEMAKLRADANKHTNVTVQRGTGHISAFRPEGRMLVVPGDVFIRLPGGCKRVTLPNSSFVGRYQVVRTSASCLLTQMLLWAWATERSAEHPEAKYILGWACVGTEKIRNDNIAPALYEEVTCTSGKSVVEARNEIRRMWEVGTK